MAAQGGVEGDLDEGLSSDTPSGPHHGRQKKIGLSGFPRFLSGKIDVLVMNEEQR